MRLVPLAPSLSTLVHAPRLTRKTGHDELAVALTVFTAGIESQARTIAAHALDGGADVVIGDYLMPAAMLGASLAGVPYVALDHSALPFPVVGAPPFGSGLSPSARGTPAWARAEESLRGLGVHYDAQVARASKRLGLPTAPTRLLEAPISRDLNLLATISELEPSLAPLDGPIAMIGPCLPRMRAAEESHPALAVLPNAGTSVYVSLGTVFNAQPDVFRQILDGLAWADTHVVVSAGASFEALSRSPRPRVYLFRRVPQLEVLRRVDLVVTHGGTTPCRSASRQGGPWSSSPSAEIRSRTLGGSSDSASELPCAQTLWEGRRSARPSRSCSTSRVVCEHARSPTRSA
jgi:hypothetical protein